MNLETCLLLLGLKASATKSGSTQPLTHILTTVLVTRDSARAFARFQEYYEVQDVTPSVYTDLLGLPLTEAPRCCL